MAWDCLGEQWISELEGSFVTCTWVPTLHVVLVGVSVAFGSSASGVWQWKLMEMYAYLNG